MIYATLAMSALAMPTPLPTNGTQIVKRAPPTSDLRFTSACSYLTDSLPDFCTCVDTTTLGASLACDVDVIGLDTIGVKGDFEPCGSPLHIDLEVTEADLGIDYPIAGITMGDSQSFPIPGLDWGIPGLGDAGGQMVNVTHVKLSILRCFSRCLNATCLSQTCTQAVTIDGNIAALTVTVGVDACGSVLGITTCASTVDPVDFPINLLSGEFDFSDLCTAKAKGVSVVEA